MAIHGQLAKNGPARKNFWDGMARPCSTKTSGSNSPIGQAWDLQPCQGLLEYILYILYSLNNFFGGFATIF